jgi:hypothetical protein
MSWRLPCLLAWFVLCLSGCGEGASTHGESSSAQDTGTQANGTAGGDQTSAGKPTPRYEGGEKSIERFGAEAGGSERRAILAAEQGYLGALATGHFKTACSHLSAQAQSSLKHLAKMQAIRCRQILPKLLSGSAPASAGVQAAGKVMKVRVQGDRAFVVFHAPGARLYLFTMQREGGDWKVTTLAASVLAPSAATLGTG